MFGAVALLVCAVRCGRRENEERKEKRQNRKSILVLEIKEIGMTYPLPCPMAVGTMQKDLEM